MCGWSFSALSLAMENYHADLVCQSLVFVKIAVRKRLAQQRIVILRSRDVEQNQILKRQGSFTCTLKTKKIVTKKKTDVKEKTCKRENE